MCSTDLIFAYNVLVVEAVNILMRSQLASLYPMIHVSHYKVKVGGTTHSTSRDCNWFIELKFEIFIISLLKCFLFYIFIQIQSIACIVHCMFV